MYHSGNRELQTLMGTLALADRLVERTHRTDFTPSDRAFVEGAEFFFLATADAAGRPDCSFKGGAPGFVRVLAPRILVFPDYDGNGMFKSLGNIRANPHVGLLFVALTQSPRRLRVNGRAEILFDDPAIANFAGAQLAVRVTAEHIFPNCPRYIPDLASASPSKYIPAAGRAPIEPAWKSSDDFKDVVPRRKA